MRISILTPSFNQGKFLERNIQSVINQDATDVEHIVMDGGSTDETTAILRSHGNQIRWVSEKDNGQGDALIKALAMASGDIVGWLNVDEYYEPHIFGKVVQAFNESPDAVLVFGDVRRVTADGSTIRINHQWRFDYKVCQVVTPIVFNCAAFFRRQHLLDCGGFDASWQYLMDWELYLRFMRGDQKWIRLNSTTLANFTMHPGSKTSLALAGFRSEIHRLHEREFPNWSQDQIHEHKRKQEWRMRYHMMLDGVIMEKIWFKVVRQRKYRDLFGGLPGKEIPVLSPFLRWISGEK